jgi:hypothetical protein
VPSLPGSVLTAYRDLLEQCQTAAFEDAFGEPGRFTRKTVKGRAYWYFRLPKGREKYVGPETPELKTRIAEHRKLKQDERQRRTLVAMLKRAGLPSPPVNVGELLQALSHGGVFRLRACLVGTHAFGCYAGLLGERLKGSSVMTQDLDLAQLPAVSVEIAADERLKDLGEVLRKADPSYRPVSKAISEHRAVAYLNDRKYRVDVLAANRGPERDTPIKLPALGTHGQPMRFLDYLIYDTIPAVVLHADGVVVNVPAPERFAVHKLIVAHRRGKDRDKVPKDLAQATQLINALWPTQRKDVIRVLTEAHERGSAWTRAIVSSLQLIADDLKDDAFPVMTDVARGTPG